MKKHFIFPFWILICLTVASCFNKTEEKPIVEYDNPALNKVSEQIRFNPNDAELYLTRANLFYESELYEDAIKDMKKAMSFDSASIPYRHVLSDIYFDGAKSNEALSLLEETINLFPASEGTILKLSEFQYLLEMNDPAIETIQKLMATSPDHIEGYYMLGKIYNQKGETQKAVKNYKKVLSINDKHFDALLELGTTYSVNKNKAALPYLEKAAKRSPSNPDIIFELGNYHRFQGNDDKAFDYYKQVVLLDQQYTEAHINAGIIHMENKSYEKANNLFNIAVETDPSYPSAYYYRGLSFAYLDDKEKAKADLKQALVLAPSYEEATEALKDLE